MLTLANQRALSTQHHCPTLTTTSAMQMMRAESIEIVTLLPPLPENGFVTVSMYVDDKV